MPSSGKVTVRSHERKRKDGKGYYVKPQKRKFPKRKEIIIKKPKNYKKQIPKRR